MKYEITITKVSKKVKLIRADSWQEAKARVEGGEGKVVRRDPPARSFTVRFADPAIESKTPFR